MAIVTVYISEAIGETWEKTPIDLELDHTLGDLIEVLKRPKRNEENFELKMMDKVLEEKTEMDLIKHFEKETTIEAIGLKTGDHFYYTDKTKPKKEVKTDAISEGKIVVSNATDEKMWIVKQPDLTRPEGEPSRAREVQLPKIDIPLVGGGSLGAYATRTGPVTYRLDEEKEGHKREFIFPHQTKKITYPNPLRKDPPPPLTIKVGKHLELEYQQTDVAHKSGLIITPKNGLNDAAKDIFGRVDPFRPKYPPTNNKKKTFNPHALFKGSKCEVCGDCDV